MDSILDESFFAPPLSKKRNRVFASLIDLGIVFTVGIIMLTSFGERYETENGVGYHLTGILSWVPFFVWLLIVLALEGITGQSLGKTIVGIKVISKDNSKASFGQVIVRHLFDIVDWAPGFGLVGLLVASNNQYKQRVGDLVAKTIVIRKNNNSDSEPAL